MIAYDSDTGKLLTDEEMQKAADNPLLWPWVVWV